MSSQQPPPPPEPGNEGYPGMGSMPMSQPPAPTQVTQPPSIALAVKLMYVGAVLSLLSVVLGLAMRDAMREAVEKSAADSGSTMEPAAVDAAVAAGLVFSVIFGLIYAGVWILMAVMNGKGKSWARIVATVLFAINAVLTLISLAAGSAMGVPQPGAALVLSLVTLLLGAVVILLLWKKESSAYYQARSAPRY